MNQIDIAWAAGIIDGEGCISVRRKNTKLTPRYCLTVHVKMSHKPTIERLKNMFSVGYIYKQLPGRLNKKVTWRWEVYNQDTIQVLNIILPHLFTKKDEAILALSYEPLMGRFYTKGERTTPKEIVDKRQEIYTKLREMKLHEFAN